MITNLFRKSTPLNYSLVIIGIFIFYFLYQFQHFHGDNSILNLLKNGLVLVLLFASLFTTNFIIKKNELSRDSAYAVLFYFLFLLFIPSVWNNCSLVFSNFFILLSLRRLLSLHSLKLQKEKIFDASLWVFTAAIFNFWSILFIILVFISILFHVARDYRYWFLPLIAFFTAASVVIFVALIENVNWIYKLTASSNWSYYFKFDYFQNNFQNIAFSIYVTIALFFLVAMVLSLSNRPLILHASYKKIMLAFLIGFAILVISPKKSNELLLFTFAPMAIMASSHLEISQVKWQKEVLLWIVISCALLSFISQL